MHLRSLRHHPSPPLVRHGDLQELGGEVVAAGVQLLPLVAGKDGGAVGENDVSADLKLVDAFT